MIETTPYGTNEIGTPKPQSDGRGWYRIDIWTSIDGQRTPERRFALGPDDQSPMARLNYAGQGNCFYHAGCSCCWLGFSHTLALHQHNTADLPPES